jgi:hypothetical protein
MQMICKAALAVPWEIMAWPRGVEEVAGQIPSVEMDDLC